MGFVRADEEEVKVVFRPPGTDLGAEVRHRAAQDAVLDENALDAFPERRVWVGRELLIFVRLIARENGRLLGRENERQKHEQSARCLQYSHFIGLPGFI